MAPTRPTSVVIATNAQPVPKNPSATTASVLDHANSEFGSETSAAGASNTSATICARSRTGSAPYRCWSGTAMLTATP